MADAAYLYQLLQLPCHSAAYFSIRIHINFDPSQYLCRIL